MLNRRKGPAVRGPRAQADRKLYRQAMQAAISAQPNLEVIEGEVDDLIVKDGRIAGVVLLDGRRIGAKAVVLTTGTFLRGLIHRGEETVPAGRIGEKPALGLSKRFEAMDFQLGRLKTGTPARLDGTSIDFSGLEEQRGDDPPEPFSMLTDAITTPQISCYHHAHNGRNPPDHRSKYPPLGDVLRPHPEPRSALLPVDRRQGRALRRSRQPPDLPRAGGSRRSDDLSQRALDLPARRGPGGLPQVDAGA